VGALVRSDELNRLSSAGWAGLIAHGVRTIIDLRNDDELGTDAAPRPRELATVHLPLDASDHTDFWDDWMHGPQFATPLYYRPHLERFPERTARVARAVAVAPPGGVLFHCVGGRDRSGQIAMVLLALAGVPAEQVAADYALSAERLTARYAALGERDQGPELTAFLAGRGTSAAALVEELVATLDFERLLLDGGVRSDELAALRERLLA
jgi:protein tyrosine/serine phosphatase